MYKSILCSQNGRIKVKIFFCNDRLMFQQKKVGLLDTISCSQSCSKNIGQLSHTLISWASLVLLRFEAWSKLSAIPAVVTSASARRLFHPELLSNFLIAVHNAIFKCNQQSNPLQMYQETATEFAS